MIRLLKSVACGFLGKVFTGYSLNEKAYFAVDSGVVLCGFANRDQCLCIGSLGVVADC